MSAQLYPLVTKTQPIQVLWGEERLDLFCRDGESSIIENGPYRGKSLGQAKTLLGEKLLGTALPAQEPFPLLIKTITARQSLSVQLHPDDEFSKIHENGRSGKSEIWYIIEAEQGAEVITGFHDGISAAQVRESVYSGNIEQLLKRRTVQAGDVIYIPAGTVHAIGKGIILAEIQQNSDLVYRVYDWNRLDSNGSKRELHLEKALAAAAFSDRPGAEISTTVQQGAELTRYRCAPYFTLEKIKLTGQLSFSADGQRFFILSVTDGHCAIKSVAGVELLSAGQSALIPAALGQYTLSGSATVLQSYVPGSEN